MDTNALVSDGHTLIQLLDARGVKARAAMWVHSPDTDTWRLWVVPPKDATDRREFYRQVSSTISQERDKFLAIDAGDVEMTSEEHPAIRALSTMFNSPNLVEAHLSSNTLNGFYLPDGILLRMAV